MLNAECGIPDMPSTHSEFRLPNSAFARGGYLAGVLGAYLRRNFSTRPAVSTSFCVPVKNGWHFAQMSMWRLGDVERVWYTAPHVHVIVHSTYSGCIPSFIGNSPTVDGVQCTVYGLPVNRTR